MCTGIEPMLIGALGATAASMALAPKAPNPQIATPDAPPKPTAAAKQPDRGGMVGANAAAATTGPLAGNSSTFLTGPLGVAPGTLSLGKNSLLGQ